MAPSKDRRVNGRGVGLGKDLNGILATLFITLRPLAIGAGCGFGLGWGFGGMSLSASCSFHLDLCTNTRGADRTFGDRYRRWMWYRNRCRLGDWMWCW